MDPVFIRIFHLSSGDQFSSSKSFRWRDVSSKVKFPRPKIEKTASSIPKLNSLSFEIPNHKSEVKVAWKKQMTRWLDAPCPSTARNLNSSAQLRVQRGATGQATVGQDTKSERRLWGKVQLVHRHNSRSSSAGSFLEDGVKNLKTFDSLASWVHWSREEWKQS